MLHSASSHMQNDVEWKVQQKLEGLQEVVNGAKDSSPLQMKGDCWCCFILWWVFWGVLICADWGCWACADHDFVLWVVVQLYRTHISSGKKKSAQ